MHMVCSQQAFNKCWYYADGASFKWMENSTGARPLDWANLDRTGRNLILQRKLK